MRGIIPSAILILGLGLRLFLGEGAWDIRQIVDRVAIAYMIGDVAGGRCGVDEPNITRRLWRELAQWEVTRRRSLTIRRHDLLSHRERGVCGWSGERETIEFLWVRRPGRQNRVFGIQREKNPGVTRGLLRR